MQAQILELLEQPARAARPGADPDLARPRRAGGDLRPDRGDVRGADRRDRAGARGLRRTPAPVHQAPARVAAGDRRLARRWPRRSPAGRRTRASCPRAAASGRAARTRPTSASRTRRCARCARRRRPPVTSRPGPSGRRSPRRPSRGRPDERAADGGARPERALRRATARSRARSTASRSSGAAARSSAWSASRAAASPRSRGRCSGWWRRSRAERWPATARSVGGKAALRELRRHVQMIFQDPYQTLNPRQRVSTIVAEPLRVQGVPGGEHDERVRRAMEDVGLEPGALPRPLPAPAVGRAAPARGDRRGAGARAGRADLRRAGLDARRLGARADPRRC